MLTANLKQQIKKDCLINSDIESCGLIVKGENNLIAILCKNKSFRPKKHFEVSPFDYLYCSKRGEIVGCYHSHLNSFGFSEFDKINAINHKLFYIMYHIPTDHFFEFDYNKPDNMKNYIHRKFVIGQKDCVSIVLDYFSGELGIDLIDSPRSDDWKTTAPNLLDESWKQNKNLIKIEKNQEIKKNDIILFNYCKTDSTHAGVYLGNGYFLHHPRDKFSIVEEYNEIMQRSTNYFLRVKNKSSIPLG